MASRPNPNRDLVIRGAKEHNLKNIDLRLPRDSLIVMTGLSGEPLTFAPGADASDRSYAMVAGAPALQQALVAVLAPDALALAPH